MGQCKDCKWWTSRDVGIIPCGKCEENEVHRTVFAEGFTPLTSPAILTAPFHGCIQFQQKESADGDNA